MDLHHNRDVIAGDYCENTDPQHGNNTAKDVERRTNNLSRAVTAAVGTFSSMNALDQVEINEQGYAILPVDFFPDKFKKTKNNDEEAIFLQDVQLLSFF